ncbi:hypothetical protein J6590_021140 [Homalodisca vitripennis]|nr:hypothetical protein J6590_021140 [Homalodisca vitripennis]
MDGTVGYSSPVLCAMSHGRGACLLPRPGRHRHPHPHLGTHSGTRTRPGARAGVKRCRYYFVYKWERSMTINPESHPVNKVGEASVFKPMFTIEIPILFPIPDVKRIHRRNEPIRRH